MRRRSTARASRPDHRKGMTVVNKVSEWGSDSRGRAVAAHLGEWRVDVSAKVNAWEEHVGERVEHEDPGERVDERDRPSCVGERWRLAR